MSEGHVSWRAIQGAYSWRSSLDSRQQFGCGDRGGLAGGLVAGCNTEEARTDAFDRTGRSVHLPRALKLRRGTPGDPTQDGQRRSRSDKVNGNRSPLPSAVRSSLCERLATLAVPNEPSAYTRPPSPFRGMRPAPFWGVETVVHVLSPCTTGFSRVPIPSIEIRTRSAGFRLNSSGGTIPVPVKRITPLGKQLSAARPVDQSSRRRAIRARLVSPYR